MGYDAVHRMLRVKRGPARDHRCCGCGLWAKQWAYDHEDPEEVSRNGRTYSTDLAHYFPLCGPCHFRFDAPFSADPRRSTGMVSPGYPATANVRISKEYGHWPPPARPKWPPSTD
jgi:hypothetical protein